MKRDVSTGSGQAESVLRRVGRGVLALLMGVAMAAVVFLALPLLQIIQDLGKDQLVRSAPSIVQPPPPPPMIEEPPPDEPPPPEEKPKLQENPQPLSLAALDAALNPGGGTGAAMINDALRNAASSHAAQLFSSNEVDRKPRPVQQVPPQYPAELRRQQLGGTVELSFVVDTQGRVVSPTVDRSPHPALSKAALDALRQWRFEAGEKDGKKVPFKMKIPIRFAAQ